MKDRKPILRRRTVAQPPRHHEAPRTQLRSSGRKPPFSRPIRVYPPRNPAVFALITAPANPADDSLTHTPLPGRWTASKNRPTRTRSTFPIRSNRSSLNPYIESAARIAYPKISGAQYCEPNRIPSLAENRVHHFHSPSPNSRATQNRPPSTTPSCRDIKYHSSPRAKNR